MEGETSRYFIVTGIPRSGTSFLSAALSSFPDIVCLNEILYPGRGDVIDQLREVDQRLADGLPIPNKVNSEGRLSTDTLLGTRVEEMVIDKRTVARIGSKINVPYFGHLDGFVKRGLPVIALVREPCAAICSWNKDKANRIPEAHVMPGDMHKRWQGIEFATDSKITRQAELWNHLASFFAERDTALHIVRYEDLIARPDSVFAELRTLLGLGPHAIEDTDIPDMLSAPSADAGVDPVTESAVSRYAPLRLRFGYA